MPKRLRYTMWHVTVNSNFAPSSSLTERRMVARLKWFVKTVLGDASNWRALVKVEPDFNAVEAVRIDAIGIERGELMHRLHVHFVVTLEHRGKAYARYGREQYQALFKKHLPEIKNPYVSMQLMNASTLNYAMKKNATVEEIASVGIQPSVVF